MKAQALIDQIDSWCSEQPSATVDNTFGDDTNVHRVGTKIFAMVHIVGDPFVTLKVPPEEGLALQQLYVEVRPGYYMNKRHWITIDFPAPLLEQELRELITQSHRIVAATLTAKMRTQLGF